MIALVALLSLSVAEAKPKAPPLTGHPPSAEAPPPPVAEVAPAPPAAPTGPDRSKPPEVVPPEIRQQPEPEVHELSPSVHVAYVRVPGARKVEIHVIQQKGALDVDGWPTAAAEAAGNLQDKATTAHDSASLAELEKLQEIDLASWSSNHHSGIDLDVPLENLKAGVQVLDEVLKTPAYPKNEIDRTKRETLRFYEVEAETDPHTVASNALTFAWFPKDHPFGARPDLKQWKKLNRGQLTSRQETLLKTSPYMVLVEGDLPWADVEAALAPVLKDVGQPGGEPKDPAVTPPTGTRIVAVDMKGQPQATIQMRTAAPMRDDPDRAVAEVLDFNLAGSFLSRLNSDLREEKGFTYGVHSRYSADETYGTWTVSLDVPAAHVGETVTTIEKHLDDVVAGGLTADEIGNARNASVSSWNDVMATAGTAGSFYEQLFYDQRTVEKARAELQRLDTLTPDDCKAVAAKYLGKDDGRVWVIVGDRAAIEPQLTALGLKVDWITPEQAVLGDL